MNLKRFQCADPTKRSSEKVGLRATKYRKLFI